MFTRFTTSSFNVSVTTVRA